MTRSAWRVIWEEGVQLDDTWVPLELLELLNRKHPYHGPMRYRGMQLPHDVARVCELHGLARRCRGSGFTAGARLRAFLEALERAPQPVLGGVDAAQS